jgi:glycosyltransferase family protein
MNYISKNISNYPKVKSIDETITCLINENKSIARFGDGEFFLALYRSIGFQKKDRKLQLKLIEVLKNKNEHCIVGLPELRKDRLTTFWKQFWFENLFFLSYLTNKKITYYNQSISREFSLDQMNVFMKCWENRNVIFITGKGSRFDTNHELFKNIKSSSTLYSLPTNAWADYENLKASVIAETLNIEKPLVICALGPTATVLAYELSQKGIQCFDIGHINNVYDKIKYGKATPEKLPMRK